MKRTWIVLSSFFLFAIAATALATSGGFDGRVEQAVGSYASGTLRNADALDLQGPGFVKLFVPRARWFGTYDLVQVIRYLAFEMQARFPGKERLQIGDTSQRSGGRISGHDSHQIGLDGDLAYFRYSAREQDPSHVAGFETTYVVDGGLTADYDLERNWTAMRIAVGTGRVNRIFVNAVVKKAICAYSEIAPPGTDPALGNITETLRRLRPWPGHDGHMHLRLTCPLASPRCVPQVEPPAGDGCHEVFDIKEFYRNFEQYGFYYALEEQHSEE